MAKKKFLIKYAEAGGIVTGTLKIFSNGLELYREDINVQRFGYRTTRTFYFIGTQVGTALGGQGLVTGGFSLAESAYDTFITGFTNSMNQFYNNTIHNISI